LDFVTDIVPLNWLDLSSFTRIATISPVPITEPTFGLEPFPPEPPEEVASAALEIEFVVPPVPPDDSVCLGLPSEPVCPVVCPSGDF